MKIYTLPLFVMFLTFGCNQNDENNNNNSNLAAQDILNVSYGADAKQKMDIYLPAGRSDQTKVIVLVHGGSWSGGDKSDMSYFVPVLRSQFPGHAIVNMNYRLGTVQSPGYPKQIQDIQLLLQHLKDGEYSIGSQTALVGASAGGHLSMLYAYNYDTANEIKAVASIVGPTDFLDPSYTQNPIYQYGLVNLVGPVTFQQHPDLYAEVSPITHAGFGSPPTILFYGGQDPLVPATQGPRLKAKLDEFNVYNELYLYQNGGHGDWDAATMLDFQTKLIAFLQARL